MPNRLAQATSPYLLQHADNPVDWWPWCPEALAEARRLDRPILLSIGYSACHWCHVMAHESFEDPHTAEVMNRLFVNIKVDREERPDLDRIYQNAHYLLTGRPGGWPLTIFLTPDDQTPFYSGTYFPPQARHGLPGFRDLLQGVAQAYATQKGAIDEQRAALVEALERLCEPPPAGAVLLGPGPIEAGRRALQRQFDPRHGGFGGAPKFPHPDNLALLLRGPEQARQQALFTLRKMAQGGLFDQLGGGFYRYSVDERWEIPHFEKMLYDNAQLVGLYADAWASSGDPLLRHACQATAAWLLDEMRDPKGPFYASLDADSPGGEGAYYLWTPDEIRPHLSAEAYRCFALRYGLDGPPNFEGAWHLVVRREEAAIAQATGLTEARVRQLLEEAEVRLQALRRRRPRPGRDDKCLTGWNALAIRGLARAGRLLDHPDWIEAAIEAARFLEEHLWRDGRLLAVHKEGRSHLAAYLDDHAWLIQALLELLQCRWHTPWLDWAQALAEVLLRHFEDRQRGGFYFTADDHEPLLQRPKGFTDDATPSGNGSAALGLLELAELTGQARYRDAARRTLEAAWGALLQGPEAHASLLLALDAFLAPGQRIVLRGPAADLAPWQAAARNAQRFDRRLYAIPDEAEGLPAPLAAHAPRGRPCAWICEEGRCLPPLDDLAAFRQTLEAPA